MGRAKTVVQLKPRNPDNPLKTSIPIKAICDYRQIEVPVILKADWILNDVITLSSQKAFLCLIRYIYIIIYIIILKIECGGR